MKRCFAIFVLMTGVAFGQVNNPAVVPVSSAPGTCGGPLPLSVVSSTGALYSCAGTTPTLLGPGGNAATATTATNLSGGSVAATTITASGATTLSGELTGTGHRNVTSPSGTAVTTTLVADQSTWTGTSPGPFTHVTGNTTALTVSSGGAVVAGQSYLLTYSLVAAGTGGVTPQVGSVACSAQSATGTYTCWVTATATTAASFTPATAFTGTMTFTSLVPQGPAFTSCGTTVVAQGADDHAGRVTTAISGCAMAFQTAYTNTPACVFTPDTLPTAYPYVSAASNSSVTFTAAGMLAFNYVCVGMNE